MSVSYFELYGTEPILYEDAGYFQSPTIRQINKITLSTWQLFVSLMHMNKSQFMEIFSPKIDATKLIAEESITVYDLLVINQGAVFTFEKAFSFFGTGKFHFDVENKIFTEDIEGAEDKVEGVGVLNPYCDQPHSINRDNFDGLRKFILSLNYQKVPENFADKTKSKQSKVMQELMAKFEKGRAKVAQKTNKKTIAGLGFYVKQFAAYSPNMNLLDVYDLTINQFYEQFYELQNKRIADLNFRNYSIWGGKKKFNPNSWATPTNDNEN